jgi:tetratricopeptide (TPR) repeat protein
MSIYSLMQLFHFKITGFSPNFVAVVMSSFLLSSCGPDPQLVGDMMEDGKRLLLAQPKLDELSRRIKANPKDVKALHERAALCIDLDLSPLAETDYSSIIKVDPGNVAAYVGRGQLSYRKFDAQCADFNQALKLEPNNAEALISRGSIYYEKGELTKAESDLLRGLKLEPHDFDGNVSLGGVYNQMGKNQKAIEYYSRAIAEDPDDVDVYFGRAQTFGEMGRYEDAIKDATKAIELNPKESAHYSNRATFYISMRRYRDALNDLNKAISMDGKNFWMYRQRASVYRELGDDQKANDDEYTAERVAKEAREDYGKLIGQ